MFAKAVLEENFKVFMVYINNLVVKVIIYLAKKARIFLLFLKKITIPIEY